MHRYMKRKRFTIFGKLVLAFLVVMAPLLVLGVAISDRGAGIVEKEISGSLRQQVQFYLLSLETEIDRMTNLQREFMNDEDLDSLSLMVQRMSLYEQLSAAKRLQARLRMIKESSVYISSAKAYLPSIHRVVSSEGDIGDLNQTTLDEVKESSLRSAEPIIYEGERLYIREFYPSPYNLNVRNPSFILELEIAVPELYRFLEQLPGYSNGGAALVGDSAVIVSGRHADSFGKIRDKLNQTKSAWLEAGVEGTGASDDGAAQTAAVAYEDGNFLIAHQYSAALNLRLIVYVPENEVMGPLENYRTYLWVALAVAVMVLPLFAYWIYRIIHRPLRKLVGAFRKVEAGMMQVEIRHDSNDEFQYLYEKFNDMVAHLNKLIYEVYEQKIRLQQSELKQLQSQINPHFLYNSFYLIYRMTKAYDIDNATRFTRFLGDYYQYLTRNAKEEVLLADEIRHVQSYIEIQSIRFGDRIMVSLEELPEAMAGLHVPRLILQPIVENAYQHGFGGDTDNCLLRIGFRCERTQEGVAAAVIRIEDNGIGLPPEEMEQWRRTFARDYQDAETTGMLNVHRRLRLKFGDSAGIRLHSAGAGLSVEVVLPLPESDAEDARQTTNTGGN
ncbi:sensor histidine kinase [Paenibacillus soyae]|uniref:Histidine kinase n=1 Tax=Paenibacillus soyae TaxID=2969249 RepID=A0A9X2MQ89_9BACL|nr:histidine kinase [Paenibacillus soyae]MCR2804866.1 histidine kinase [Paenibacillus soyae]